MNAIAKKAGFDLPNSFESEQALLGTLVANPAAISMCAELVPDDFFEGLHGRFFAFVADQITRTGKALPTAIISHFRNDETLTDAGMTASEYVARLVGCQETAAAVKYLAQQIKNDAALRGVHSLALNLADKAVKPEIGDKASDVIARAVDELIVIANNSGQEAKKTRFAFGDLSANIISSINDVFVNGVVPSSGAFFGTERLNHMFNGLREGRLYIVAGRPGMGKSTLATSLLIRTALKGHPVLFFSPEMPAEEQTYRVLADLTYRHSQRVEYGALERGEVSKAQFESVIEASEIVRSVDLVFVDKAGPTISEIRAHILRERDRLATIGRRLKVVCIDHLGKMKASNRYSGNLVAETGEIVSELKNMAKEFGVAVVALAQLSRKVEERDDKRPMLSDLRWSGDIEQEADAVLFCYRPAYYLENQKCDDPIKEGQRLTAIDQVRNKMEIIVAKNRGGACGNVEMFCDVGCAAVRDLQ
jgi:replicative DNA helicase